jgi:hypothetical protein
MSQTPRYQMEQRLAVLRAEYEALSFRLSQLQAYEAGDLAVRFQRRAPGLWVAVVTAPRGAPEISSPGATPEEALTGLLRTLTEAP